MEPTRSDFCRDFESATHKRETGGMRSVASAPDFSQMKRMHDTFKSTDTAKTKSKRNQTVRSTISTTQPPYYLFIVHVSFQDSSRNHCFKEFTSDFLALTTIQKILKRYRGH
jgi:hypothetical protein